MNTSTLNVPYPLQRTFDNTQQDIFYALPAPSANPSNLNHIGNLNTVNVSSISSGNTVPSFSSNMNTINPSIATNYQIENFTLDDLNILKSLLPSGERHKWKYLANKLCQFRGKRSTSTCLMKKNQSLIGLPSEEFTGELGSSLPYIVSKNGWNDIDNA